MSGHLRESVWQAGQGGLGSSGWKDKQTPLCPSSGPTPCHKPARCVLCTKPLHEGPQDARSGAKCGPRCFEVSEALSLQSLTLLLLRGAGALSSPGSLSQTLFWGPRLSKCNPAREAVETSGSEGHLQSRKRHLRVRLCNKHLCEVCSAARDPSLRGAQGCTSWATVHRHVCMASRSGRSEDQWRLQRGLERCAIIRPALAQCRGSK